MDDLIARLRAEEAEIRKLIIEAEKIDDLLGKHSMEGRLKQVQEERAKIEALR